MTEVQLTAPIARPELMPGTEVIIGGKPYTAPKLNFAGHRDCTPLLEKAGTDISRGSDLLIEVLYHSLRRNYGGASKVWLQETIEADEIITLMTSMRDILVSSGMIKVKKPTEPGGAADPEGEATASRSA